MPHASLEQVHALSDASGLRKITGNGFEKQVHDRAHAAHNGIISMSGMFVQILWSTTRNRQALEY